VHTRNLRDHEGRLGAVRWWFSLLVGLVLGACISGVASIGPSEHDPLTLDAWCAAQPADRCVEALTFLHGTPEQELGVKGSLQHRLVEWSVEGCRGLRPAFSS